MIVGIPKILTKAFWTRNRNGDNFYDLTSYGEWAEIGDSLEMAQDHPILTPAMLFVSKLFSQARFRVVNEKTGKEVKNHWMTNLLSDPNEYQTQQDFMETLMFMQIARGVAVGYFKRNVAFDDVDDSNSFYLLDYNKIEWPEGFESKITNRAKVQSIKKTKVKYDPDGENLTIAIKDLVFFYDLPNCLKKDKFKVKSRLDGLGQTLVNTKDSLTAKNIILKTNGKELITGKKDSIPLNDDEKKDVETLYHTNYGLARNRKRGIITKADLNHKSLHIALRDLGLDESVKVDGNLIYTALHIPKDILSLEAKKTTYNNFKESMTSYVQNEMQSSVDAACAVLNKLLEDGFKLEGDFEHLPIMQYILIERYKVKEGLGKAISALRSSGLPDEIVLELVGLDTTIQLEELKQTNNGNENSNESQPTSNSEQTDEGND